jgi:hypothetical protein
VSATVDRSCCDPVAAPTQTPAANANGWNNSDVTVFWNWSPGSDGAEIDPARCTTSTTHQPKACSS